MKDMRLDEMEQYILQCGAISLPALCKTFDVSMNTVRRDVAKLLARGTVQKVYGGVRARRSEQLTSFDARTVARSPQKQAIGAAAATLIADGDIVYVDSGTTTMYIAQHLQHLHHATLLTNNLQCINLAAANPNINVLVLPGKLQRETYSVTGMETILQLRKYHIHKAFMAATAVSLTNGVTNSSSLEYEIKRTALQQSEAAYLLVDAAKFDRTAMLTYAQLADFSGVITDVRPPEPYCERLDEAKVSLIMSGV